MASELTEVAMHYAELGFRVFPAKFTDVWQRGKTVTIKKPLMVNGHNDASDDPLEVERMFTGEHPRRVAGTRELTPDILGMVHNRFLVIDVDVKHDSHGLATFETIRHLLPRPLAKVETASGGFHVWYPNPTKPERKTNYLPGIDVLAGEKGWIAVPPTTGYKFLEGSIEDVHETIA